MNRRELLAAGSFPLLSPVLGRGRPEYTATERSLPIFERLVQAGDASIPQLLGRQQMNASAAGYGGVADEYGILPAGTAAGLIRAFAASWCAPRSRYQRNAELLRRMELAAAFLCSLQHPDGTIDLYTTNFHSPPDTAFVVEPVALALSVLRKTAAGAFPKLEGDLVRFLESAGHALSVGGIHTPNHRWVVCSALARLHSLMPDPRYPARVQEWLSEGIDIDEDGQYTEKSVSIYSPVCDNALMTVARLLDRPQLLEPVRRNLAMTLFYLHAGGELATEGSRRQDQYERRLPTGYHIPARYIALHDVDRTMAAFTTLIEEKAGDGLAGNLIYFLDQPELRAELPAPQPLPEDFSRFFRASDLVRVRRGPVSAGILGGNACFFAMRKGDAVLQAVRLASAFFGKGQFLSEPLRTGASGVYQLRQELTAPYYQPLAPSERRADGNWNLMDRSRRRQSEVQQLTSAVSVGESNGRFTIDIYVAGTKRVPVALELSFPYEGELSGVVPLEEGSYLVKAERAAYRMGRHTIGFGPGRAEHRYVQLRGALPKLAGRSVYLTGFTPFRHRLEVG